MVSKNKLVTVIGLLFLCACGQNKTEKGLSSSDKTRTDKPVLTMDTFSTFPPEINGCSCYFSKDSSEFKKNAYIYIDNYAQVSFLKINGVLVRFSQIEFKEIDSLNSTAKYKSDNYEMTIELRDGIQNGDETRLKTGTIILTDNKGQRITKRFYGECGC